MSRFQIIPPDDLANDFSDYFVQKIERSNDSPDALQSSEPVLGDDDVSAENTGECADCVLICANVQSSQTSRPSFFDYWKGSHEILSFRSCTYICGSTGS